MKELTCHLEESTYHLEEFSLVFFVNFISDVNSKDKIKIKKHIE